MYGSWYCGSQASSWIFWWAFARLCRLTSTPHGRGRDSVGAVGRPGGPCGNAFSIPRKARTARASRTLRQVGGERGAVPPHRVPRGTDHSGSPGGEWSQYETSLTSPVPRVVIPRVDLRGARPAEIRSSETREATGCPW